MKFNASIKSTVFFAQITAVLFISSDANNGKNQIDTKILSSQPSIKSAPKTEPILHNGKDRMECDVLQPDFMMGQLPKLLTPDIFSEEDPISFFVDKLQNTQGLSIFNTKFELNTYYNLRRLPLCYMPYVKALSSIVRFWSELESARRFIIAIRARRSSKLARISALPSNISPTSELYQLFTSEIFFDPQIPVCAFKKLLSWPEEDLQNIRAQLHKFVNESPKFDYLKFQEPYTWYAIALNEIIRDESVYDEMRRNIDEIMPTSMAYECFSIDEPTITYE